MNDLLNLSLQDISHEALIILNSLHFIRGEWFYAFIPLLLFLLFSFRTRLNNRNWLSVIDSQLLPHVLSQTGIKQRRYPLLLILIAGSLCITALAGPVYKKLPQPIYREQSALVVLLDLSQSMNATDIKSSRLSRAKLELLDLLKTRKTGQTALVVYAADAFVVTPLTDDNATIANLVPSLETDMMPAQGSNLSNALEKTTSLFSQSGTINGDILVITDDVHQRDKSAIKKVVSQGHRLSILGIGTAEGSPIPLPEGGFLQNSNGAIVLPRLDSARLQSYALSGSGLYTALQADDGDVEKLAELFQSTEISEDIDTQDLSADVWQEEGYWLLLPLLFFAALWARKGWIAALVLFVSSTAGPLPAPAYAETDNTPVLDTRHLWSSPDQKAMKAFNEGDSETAAREFDQPDWKASAYYRSGDYEAAAKILEHTDSSDGFYNKANALAKLGKYEEAIKAYDKALELDETNEDAEYNREQVKQALQEQQQESQQQGEQQQDQDGEQQEQESQDSQQQDGQQQDGQQQEGEQQDQQKDSEQQSDENDADQQQQSSLDGKPQENDQQEQEQEQLKQRDAEAESEQQKKEDQQYQQEQDEQKDKPENDEQSNAEADKNQEVENKDSEDKPMDIEVNPMEASITEQEKASEQWLKRIPDDPGGLLRRKFHYQYKQIPNQTDSEQPW